MQATHILAKHAFMDLDSNSWRAVMLEQVWAVWIQGRKFFWAAVTFSRHFIGNSLGKEPGLLNQLAVHVIFIYKSYKPE